MKLGLLVPFVMSILLFGEMPTVLQVIGFVIAIVAIIAINYQKDDTSSKFSLGLIFLLLIGGSADVMA
jgi:drug/metabolite transporter (DMT)-like permease